MVNTMILFRYGFVLILTGTNHPDSYYIVVQIFLI